VIFKLLAVFVKKIPFHQNFKIKRHIKIEKWNIEEEGMSLDLG